MQLGSLFGQDLVKIASIALLIVGVAVATVGSIAGWANVQDTIGGFLGMLGS
jgi:hypothetical protein